MTDRIYLDHNATSPLHPEVRAAMDVLYGQPLNPSSIHAEGRRARAIIEDARGLIAGALNCFPGEIIFTGSATESNNLAIRGFRPERVLVSTVEHPSVLNASEALEHIPVNAQGVVRLDALEELLKSDETPALISVMLANNETGVIQPIEQIVALARQYNALVHTDAVQGLGRIPLDFSHLGVDLMTISSHKAGGPTGAAVLIVRDGLTFEPLLRGGGQESNRRAGTENVAAIAGLAKAVELAPDMIRRLNALEPKLWELEVELEALGAHIVGKAVERLPNTSCILMPEVAGSTQLMNFDLAGLAVSSGSACTSGKVGKSHVLQAMGVAEELGRTAVRVSAGWNTGPEDLIRFGEEWKKLHARLGKTKEKGLEAA